MHPPKMLFQKLQRHCPAHCRCHAVTVTRVFAAVGTHQTAPPHRRRSRKAASASFFSNFPKPAFLLAAPAPTGSGWDSSWIFSPAAALSSCNLVGVQAFLRSLACGVGFSSGVVLMVQVCEVEFLRFEFHAFIQFMATSLSLRSFSPPHFPASSFKTNKGTTLSPAKDPKASLGLTLS